MAFGRIAEGLKEALAVARGEQEPAKITQYVSDRVFDGCRKVSPGKVNCLRRNHAKANPQPSPQPPQAKS